MTSMKATHNTIISILDIVNHVLDGGSIDRLNYSVVYQILVENYGESFSIEWSMGMTTKFLSPNHPPQNPTTIEEDTFVMSEKFKGNLESLKKLLHVKLAQQKEVV